MSVIPEKELTFQYKSTKQNQKPNVADGTEIKVFVQNKKNIFQKEPNFIPKQRSPSDHNKGANTLVTDTVKANHKFEIEGQIFAKPEKGFSLDSSIRGADDNGQKTSEFYTVDELDRFFFLGDTEIEFGSETVQTQGGTTLTRGTDYEMDYGRGRIKFLSSSPNLTTTDVQKEIILGLTTTVTQVDQDFSISYNFNGDANNVAKLLQRMGQLGGPVVMRVNKKGFLGPSGEERGTAHTVVPLKVEVLEKAEKPGEVKVNMELRRASSAT